MGKYRSKFEGGFALNLKMRNVDFGYESEVINYIVPESKHKYTPDFIIDTLSGNKIYLEAKGYLDLSMRKKMVNVRNSNLDKDIRFVFQNSKVKISKGSKTSYADWCIKNNFQYCDKVIPLKWLEE